MLLPLVEDRKLIADHFKKIEEVLNFYKTEKSLPAEYPSLQLQKYNLKKKENVSLMSH